MRRRSRIAFGIALVFVLGAAAFWFVLVPHRRPALREGERYGIDVASHQGRIDWERVASDEIEFAYVKATEGGDFIDRRFEDNWRAAAGAGLERGAYHFFTLCTPGADQADHFVRVAAPDVTALAPAVDLELAGNCADRPSRSRVLEELGDFVEIVEAAWGRELVLYVGDDFEARYPVRATMDRPLWHRRLFLRPDVDGWTIWQVHGYARVEGIDGGVDLDVMRAT